jgi:hypothetical protein
MNTGWIIAACIIADMLLERLKKIEQGSRVCYYVTSGPLKSIQDTTVSFLRVFV